MKRSLKVIGAVIGGIVLLSIGVGIGAATKATPAAITRTVTHTVKVNVPGPTVTKIVTKTVTVTPKRPAHARATMPGDGTFAVGTAAGDWAPGTWRTSGAQGGSSGDCYWATLSNLSGSFNSIISNNNITGPTILTVSASVAGVEVSGCNPWHKVG